MGEQRRRKSGGRNRIWGERQITRKFISKGGRIIEMDVAFAYVDFSAYNLPTQNQQEQKQIGWSCGLTARKEENYKHRSKAKRKRRRYVPADRVYYIQSANPLQ